MLKFLAILVMVAVCFAAEEHKKKVGNGLAMLLVFIIVIILALFPEEHHHHEPAVSSQHFERHDVPAHPPKDFHKYDGTGKYEYDYKVEDHHTGDKKHHHEARDGHHVKGVYSLHQPDGSIRSVKYEADKKTGFQTDIKLTTKHEHKHHH